MENEPTEQEIKEMMADLASETSRSSVESVTTYCVPLAYDLTLEAEDTQDGGDFRIPIVLAAGRPAIVTLIPTEDQSTLTIRVSHSISTTPSD